MPTRLNVLKVVSLSFGIVSESSKKEPEAIPGSGRSIKVSTFLESNQGIDWWDSCTASRSKYYQVHTASHAR